jgi:hypothetical protein
MRTRSIVVTSVVLAAVALGWTLRLHEPAEERATTSDERSASVRATDTRAQVEPDQRNAASRSPSNEDPIDVADRVRFNDQAREFFAQAPALPPDEARQRAEQLSQELSRIERAGGMSAGESFLLRAGLIRAAEPDEQQQAAQIKALKQRYEIDSRQRTAQASAQSDPMFQLYKVRESEVVAEVMSLQTVPDGLSREEYLRRRLQQTREQLLGDAM